MCNKMLLIPSKNSLIFLVLKYNGVNFDFSLVDISREHIAVKSVRQNLVKKLISEYSSPTMWPEDFLASMGRLLEDVSVQQLTLLRHGAVRTSYIVKLYNTICSV